MTRTIRAAALLALVLAGCALSALDARARNPAADGLTLIGEGAASFYAPGWDGAGWDRIRTVQARNHGLDPADVYDEQGYYCVRIGSPVGSVLTLRNENTGVTLRCVVADVNAPADNAVWASRWVVEVAYRLFAALGLPDGNHVSVWEAT